MATLSEHVNTIRAAFQAARDDGFELVLDVATVYYSGEVESVELDLWDGVEAYANIDVWNESEL